MNFIVSPEAISDFIELRNDMFYESKLYSFVGLLSKDVSFFVFSTKTRVSNKFSDKTRSRWIGSMVISAIKSS